MKVNIDTASDSGNSVKSSWGIIQRAEKDRHRRAFKCALTNRKKIYDANYCGGNNSEHKSRSGKALARRGCKGATGAA